ncbi:WecB/TagA/CpsF family glycosyltransferase [Proteiniclasticum sp. SCR006]|uniref:WecB/TagA/CpsF family glycosyltransferase n=1 Tax=Proteiniclasticum aestuarii TaxID=2817862 RepID=A0A939HE91_9CLOT|nr:WecB/TagA/CpsF family glycosyltransferase [Proteiniclasticum aestuarii]MBO1266321.1 WecB/TagA/CpsF family glycosyltransferase [Proteiniclasticum aestuarii]
MKRESVMGLQIVDTTYDELIFQIREDLENDRKRVIVAINPEKIMKIKGNPFLAGFVRKADYLIPDGVGILMASKKLGGHLQTKITGIDTMIRLCKMASVYGYKVFLLGGKSEVVHSAKLHLEERFQGIQIAGTQDGYHMEDVDLIQKINESGAQILFVALGSPKQEYWISENKDKLSVNIFQGVGGSFDVLGQYVKRAPVWMQDMGIEWLYRLLKNPSRIFRQMNLLRFYRLIRKEKKGRV